MRLRQQQSDAVVDDGRGGAAGSGAGAWSATGVGGSRGSASTTTRLPSIAEPGGGESWYSAPDSAKRRDLERELEGMADQIGEVDARSAERMRDLAVSVGREEGQARWSHVDLRRAFNTEHLSLAYAEHHAGRFAAKAVEQADRVRNVLVLVPIFLTWFALAEASKAYDRYLEINPEAVREPFLLLWQRGFGGEASGLAPTFSMVAIVDALIIGAIIGLTFYAHGRREAREDQIHEVAQRFQIDLDNILAEAVVILAGDLASRPALLARSVERLSERFDQSSQELLTRLRVEHDRLEQIANRREQEFADFGVFTSGMRAGAEETHRMLLDLRQVSQSLQAALEDMTSEVSSSTDQGRTLLSAVQSLERLTGSALQSDQAVTRQLSSAAATLAEASDRSVAGAEAAAQAARVATEAVRGIADIASTLASGQARAETALAAGADANARLADAMRSGSGGMAASTKSLQEIAQGLVGLRDDLGELAAHSAQQAGTLGKLLRDQGEIAGGIGQVARDLSAVGIATAQRQREVNEDVAQLIERLEHLTNLLARATAAAPTPDAIAQALRGALRSEMTIQADLIADAIDARSGAAPAVPAGWPAPRRGT